MWTASDRAAAAAPYLERTGLGKALGTEGNAGGVLLRGAVRDGRVDRLSGGGAP